MTLESETGFISLAELAELQTDEIKTLMSRLPTRGIFTVRGGEVKAAESRTEGKPPLFRFGFQMEILEAEPLDPEEDAEKLVGRGLRESYTIWPDQFDDCIGLLKGRYEKIGLSNTGKLGGVEGHDPGWLDGIIGHIFRVRVRHFESKRGTQAAFDWLPLETATDEDKEEAA